MRVYGLCSAVPCVLSVSAIVLPDGLRFKHHFVVRSMIKQDIKVFFSGTKMSAPLNL